MVWYCGEKFEEFDEEKIGLLRVVLVLVLVLFALRSELFRFVRRVRLRVVLVLFALRSELFRFKYMGNFDCGSAEAMGSTEEVRSAEVMESTEATGSADAVGSVEAMGPTGDSGQLGVGLPTPTPVGWTSISNHGYGFRHGQAPPTTTVVTSHNNSGINTTTRTTTTTYLDLVVAPQRSRAPLLSLLCCIKRET
ncbi:hypothetical protein Sjap_000927 [Stephania japonica]|uniref:Uncharacterized protein n=1 Tax=Stephania japonica TaxID=461633 RepID=A0AAP0KJ13_9MAGN